MTDPVRLDPFQNIVNVHWPSHLAVSLGVDVWKEHDSITCSTPETSDTNRHGGFLTKSQYRYTSEDKILAAAKRIAGQWQTVGGATSSGLPGDSPEFSFGPFEYPADGAAGMYERNDFWPWGRWQAVTGTEMDLTVPGDPSKTFREGTSATFETYGDIYTSGPTCNVLPSGIGQAAFYSETVTSIVGRGSGDFAWSPHAFDFSAAVVRVAGKAYRPVGRMTAGDASQTRVLWLLCKRSPGDDE